jgi:hypothetical protein
MVVDAREQNGVCVSQISQQRQVTGDVLEDGAVLRQEVLAAGQCRLGRFGRWREWGELGFESNHRF